MQHVSVKIYVLYICRVYKCCNDAACRSITIAATWLSVGHLSFYLLPCFCCLSSLNHRLDGAVFGFDNNLIRRKKPACTSEPSKSSHSKECLNEYRLCGVSHNGVSGERVIYPYKSIIRR